MAVDVKTMEIKKTQQVAAPANPSKEATQKSWSIKEFVGDVKAELKKITWTSPDELRAYTKIVVGTTFILGMSIYFTDLCIQLFLNGLSFLVRLIGG